MTAKTHSEVVWCERKKRHVQIEVSKVGSWFNPEYQIDSCPALGDAGGGCDQSCRKQIGMLASVKRMQNPAPLE